MIEVQPETLAPCGLYCGVCRIRQATEENDVTYLERLARLYARRFPEFASASSEQLLCDGCLSARRFLFCQACAIRDCAQQKGLEGCHECLDFPCTLVDEFPMPAGQKVMQRSVPYRRTHGTEQWIAAEVERYRCPECGQRLYRGARQCGRCKAPVAGD